jgi:hypothetical protein
MLSSRTRCGLTLCALVAGPSRLAHFSGLPHPALVSGLSGLARVSGHPRHALLPWLSCVTVLPSLAGLSNLSLRSGWSWRRRCVRVAPGNKEH